LEIKVAAGDIAAFPAGAVIIGVFEDKDSLDGDASRVDSALDGAVSRLIAQGEIKGKPGEVTVIHTLGRLPTARVAVAGLGKRAELTLDRVRAAAGEAARRLRQAKADTIAAGAIGAGEKGITPVDSARAIAEGAELGAYSFRKHMTSATNGFEIRELTILGAGGLAEMEREAGKGKVLAQATILARDMVNEPGNVMTPARMAEMARELAGAHGLEATILERKQMEELGMGGLLGVSQGSRQPPFFIVLKYRGRRNSPETDVALVGKGITFDSGGISIKPSEKMEEMKGDMAGGAAVMAAVSALAQLGAKANVAAIVPATENLPGGSALKPGDIIKAMSGKTIEIISTDAEGRLILADALTYARDLKPGALVDVATLTGSMRVALGDVYTGAFGNNPALVDRIVKAGASTGELVWPMPMHEEFAEQIKSDVADIKNVGGKWGGAISAAQFLAEFALDTPWVHLDIAGTSWSEKEKGYLAKGATGVPTRTLVDFVLALAG
jgi:leucyl aminopeptidase